MKKVYLNHGIFKNKFLIGAVILGILLQVVVVIIPPISGIFKLAPLNNSQWIITVLISVMPIFIMEAQKKFEEFKFGKTFYLHKTALEK